MEVEEKGAWTWWIGLGVFANQALALTNPGHNTTVFLFWTSMAVTVIGGAVWWCARGSR